MNKTRWKRAVCLAAAAVTVLCAAAAQEGPGEAPAVPAEKRIVWENPVPNKLLEAGDDGQLCVSDETLAFYGICRADEEQDAYVLALPLARGGTMLWDDPTAALRLPRGETGAVDISLIADRLGMTYTVDGLKASLVLPKKRAQEAPQLQRAEDEDREAADQGHKKEKKKDKKKKDKAKDEAKDQAKEKAEAPGASPAGEAVPEGQERRIGVVVIWDPDMHLDRPLPSLPNTQAVMSPCAFRMTRHGIELRRNAFDRLAASYKEQGYDAWPLVDNNFDSALTHDVLTDEALQEQMIKELIGYAVLYDFKGYNLDFENVDYKDKDGLTAFVEKISKACRAYGLTLSMDVTPLSDSLNWSLVYDRPALAPSLDWMMVMAYDQFSRTSPSAGPTASYPWVEQAVKDMTAIVPAEKIVLGMPLYMRLWYESSDGKDLPRSLEEWPAPLKKGKKPPAAKGKQKPELHVRTLTMADSKALKERYEPYICWDENLHLYYLELPLPAGVAKVWFEDEKSLQEKTKLISACGLGGASFWRKGFEPPDFWQAFAAQELT